MDANIQEIDAKFLGNVGLIGEAVPVREASSSSVRTSTETQGYKLHGNDEEQEDAIEEEEDEEQEIYDGPMTWEDVDMSELGPVILRVTDAAMPLSDSKNLATRLEALQANSAENADPLGLGRVDVASVTLVKTGDVPKGQSNKVQRLQKNRVRNCSCKKGRIEDMQSLASAQQSLDVNIAELREKVMPGSDNFDPDIFLGTIHSGTSFADLLKGKQNLKAEVSEKTSQLMALVKDNFGRFIRSKNTMDDIHKRLLLSEAHDGGNGTSTSDMVVAIAEVLEEGHDTFKTLLGRAHVCDQLRGGLALLRRYEHIFQIPARIQQGVAAGDFDQVISEYKKARTLMDLIGQPKPHSLWEKLFTEVERGIKAAVIKLEDVVRDDTAPRPSSVDSIHAILQLQVEGSPSAIASKPLVLHAQIRGALCLRQLDELEEYHFAVIEAARRLDEANDITADTQVTHKDIDWTSEQEHRKPSHSGTAWATFLKDMYTLAQKSLASVIIASEGKLSQNAVAGVRQRIKEASAEVGLIFIETAVRFNRHVDAAMCELSKHEGNKELFAAAITRVATNWRDFTAGGAPLHLLTIMEDHMTYACAQVIEQMTAKIEHIIKEMPNLELFVIEPLSHKAGHPASRLPAMFRNAVAASLGMLEEIIEAAANEDEDDGQSFDPLRGSDPTSHNYSTLRRAFCDGFSNFAAALDHLWSLVVAGDDPCSKSDAEISLNTKLLILQSNCVNLRTVILKELATRYQDMLTSDGGFEEHRKLMRECAEDMRVLEGRLASVYIRARVEELNDVLEEYFEEDGTDWTDSPIPTGIRDGTYEIINCLVSVQAEVYTNAMTLQKRATEELVQHLFQAYAQCVEGKLEDINLAGALQLLLELQYLGYGLPVTSTQGDSLIDETKGSILARIKQLTEVASDKDIRLFDKWCARAGGSNASYRADVVSKLRCIEIANESYFNLAAFKV